MDLSESSKKLPELPEARRAHMISEYELSEQDARTLTASREFADRFEAAAKTAKNPRRVVNVLLSEVGGRLKALGLEQEQSPVSMAGIVLAADLLDEGKISSKQLKQLLDTSFETREDFPLVYEREKPQQITDTAAIEKLIDEVIAANPKQVEQYKGGKDDCGVLRRPGDEGFKRAGESGAAQRTGHEEARRLTNAEM